MKYAIEGLTVRILDEGAEESQTFESQDALDAFVAQAKAWGWATQEECDDFAAFADMYGLED